MAEGYIKLYRCIADSDIYKMAPLYLRVFERLVLESNHKEVIIPFKESSTGRKLIKRGERLTSLSQIAEWVGWYERGIFKIPNKKTIKVILDWLVDQKMIELLGNGKVTHYFIVNYNSYQDQQPNESNGKVTERKRSLDTNKNEENEKKNIYSEVCAKTIAFLNEISGSKYTTSNGNCTFISARIKEGFSLDDFKKVIITKWKDPDFNKKYYRPSTLFNSKKFEGYLNETRAKAFDEA